MTVKRTDVAGVRNTDSRITDRSILGVCPRCETNAGVVEEATQGVALSWFRCRLCFYIWRAPHLILH